MSGEPVVPETAQAVSAESAPAEEQKAVSAESAPAESSETPEKTGSEPAEDSKVLQELKMQRKKRQEVEQELTFWKSQAMKNQPQSGQRPESVDHAIDQTEPKIEQFENYDDYLVTLAEYRIQKKQSIEKEKKRQEELNQAYKVRCEKAKEKMPDYDDVISAATFPVPNPIIEAIKESEFGPDIAYFLAKNPDQANLLVNLNPWAAMREFGKLEMKFKLPEAQTAQIKKISQAPDPIRPVSGGAAGPAKSLDEMSIDEFIKKRNAEAFIR